MVLLLSHDDVRSVLSVGDTITILEQAFAELEEGVVDIPPSQAFRFDEPKGIIRVFSACARRSGFVGLKLSAHYPDNPKANQLPATRSTILFNDCRDGTLLAIMDGTYLTAVRTGATCGVATKYLARSNSEIAGLLGSGKQAETQLEAVCCVRPVRLAKVFSPTASHRTSFSERMSQALGIAVRAADSAEDAVIGADIVITATSAKEPVLKGEWLSPGVHVNSIGSGFSDWRELDDDVVRCSKIVVDSMAPALNESGDISIPIKKGIIDVCDIHATLSEIVVGKKKARIDEEEITLFKSVGLAIEDVVTAKFVFERARSLGLGTEVLL